MSPLPSPQALLVGTLAGLLLGAPQSVPRGTDPESRREARGPASGVGTASAVSIRCAQSLRDQSKPGECLEASSAPVPGLLFPPPHDGGVDNVSSGANAFVGGGKQNDASASHAVIGGGALNSADGYAFVGGGFGHSAGVMSTIGGGNGNVAQDVSTIGGGGFNTASGPWCAVGGGYFNNALGMWATIGGGYQNTAGDTAFVGGGTYNAAGGDRSTISGGFLNDAFGNAATVGGGSLNAAGGTAATVPGGTDNDAAGAYSFATGRRAKANHQGAFVWGDSANVDKTSSANDQFNVYAEGGVRIFAAGTAAPSLVVDPAGSVGVGTAAPGFLLEVNGSAGKPGGGAWSVSSDARLKKDVRQLEGALATLLALRGVRFEYTDPAAIRELPGPRVGFVAQEVEPVIPDWVEEGPDGMKRLTVRGFEALAVEALREVDDENRELREQVAAQTAELEALRERLDGLARELVRSEG